MSDFIDSNEIAAKLGLNPETIRRWLRSNVLRGYKFGMIWRVKVTDLERFCAEREIVYHNSYHIPTKPFKIRKKRGKEPPAGRFSMFRNALEPAICSVFTIKMSF
jgi:excisionase family DNA binding protein